MTKLFQRNKYVWDDRINKHYQFLIIKGITFLHLMYENDSPCPYTGIKVLTTLFSPDHLFGADFHFKGYSWSFYLFTSYWED